MAIFTLTLNSARVYIKQNTRMQICLSRNFGGGAPLPGGSFMPENQTKMEELPWIVGFRS